MSHEHKKLKAVDMTSGSIVRHLIMFTIPLLFGNLFQQLYNTVDSLVVGNFVGSEALAAVGSTTSIVNMLVQCRKQQRRLTEVLRFDVIFEPRSQLLVNRIGSGGLSATSCSLRHQNIPS